MLSGTIVCEGDHVSVTRLGLVILSENLAGGTRQVCSGALASSSRWTVPFDLKYAVLYSNWTWSGGLTAFVIMLLETRSVQSFQDCFGCAGLL